MISTTCCVPLASGWRVIATGSPASAAAGRPADAMSFWRRHAAAVPDPRDEECIWQGDPDPYLGRLAQEGRRHRTPPPPRGPRVEGPVDDGDPYLAELARARFAPSDAG